ERHRQESERRDSGRLAHGSPPARMLSERLGRAGPVARRAGGPPRGRGGAGGAPGRGGAPVEGSFFWVFVAEVGVEGSAVVGGGKPLRRRSEWRDRKWITGRIKPSRSCAWPSPSRRSSRDWTSSWVFSPTGTSIWLRKCRAPYTSSRTPS